MNTMVHMITTILHSYALYPIFVSTSKKSFFFSFKINTDPSSILSQALLLQLACLSFLLSFLVLKA